jgi:hypothetical protein
LQRADGTEAAPAHALRDLLVVQTSEELQDDYLLLIGRQLDQRPSQHVRIHHPRQLDRGRGVGQLEQAMLAGEGGGAFLAADLIKVRVVRQEVQPGQERPTLPSVPRDGLPGLQKDPFGEILGFRVAAGADVRVP